MNHIFDKRARKNKFCSLWGGSKQKTANSCIECQWAFKKDQAMLLYQITWKKCHTKKEKYLFSKTCDIILLLLSYFLFKGATNEVYYNGSSKSMHFRQNLCCWVDYMVQLFWKSRDTDTLTQFVPWDIEGQYFSLQFFDLLIIRAWNQTDLEHIQLD